MKYENKFKLNVRICHIRMSFSNLSRCISLFFLNFLQKRIWNYLNILSQTFRYWKCQWKTKKISYTKTHWRNAINPQFAHLETPLFYLSIFQWIFFFFLFYCLLLFSSFNDDMPNIYSLSSVSFALFRTAIIRSKLKMQTISSDHLWLYTIESEMTMENMTFCIQNVQVENECVYSPCNSSLHSFR